MDKEIFEFHKVKANQIKRLRFTLSLSPSQEEILRFLDVEKNVRQFMKDITISGGAEGKDVLDLQMEVGGEPQEDEITRAIALLSTTPKKQE